MLVSPSESPAFRELGESTWVTESWGVDVFWVARKETWGVQRKALRDLVASVEDGRLAKERMQMASLHHPYLIIETGERGGGAPREMPSGQLAGLGVYGRMWTGAQLRGVVYGLQADGIRVLWVKDEEETIARVKELEVWSRKDRHASARGRGTAPMDVFGKRGNREYGVWLLSSLPGFGVEIAGRVFDHFGGVPVQMREGVGVKELMEVRGVGKVMAQRVLDVFGVKE